MAEGQVYNIPERGMDWFKAKLTKLGKRVEKLTGERMYLTVVGFHFEDDATSKLHKTKIFEVFVAMPETKLNGWEFIARIDHANEIGNVVRVVPGMTLPEQYRNSDPVCDHCGHKRRRRDTFVVHNIETNQYSQVGSSCLRDFLGHGDADKWAKLAEFKAIVGDYYRYSCGFEGPLTDRRWIDTLSFMEHAAQSVLDYGWVSRKASREYDKIATADDAESSWNYGRKVSQDAKNLAEKAMEWAQGLGGTDNDYEHNCYVVASSEAMELRSVGIAASIVGVYYNKFVRVNPMKPDFSQSTHQGKVGDKIEVEVTLQGAYPGEFSTRHVMYDASNNMYVWFASNENLSKFAGQKIKIRGTVKGHSEFRGVKQTMVNRVKVL